MVGAGTDVFKVPGSSAPMRLWIAARLSGRDGETENLTVEIIGPRANALGVPLSAPITLQKHPDAPEGWACGLQAAVAADFVATESGIHKAYVGVGGIKKLVPIVVTLLEA
jgi:hypothetical protein